MIHFEYLWLFVLLGLPFVLRRLLPVHEEPRQALTVRFLDRLEAASGVTSARGAVRGRYRHWQQALRLAVWCLIVLALARPQWIGDVQSRTIASRDVLLAIDLSTSMEQQDFTAEDGSEIDRLQAVKFVVDDFLSHRVGDRVGLILFGSAAFIQAPFTEDLSACRTLLDEAEIGMAGPATMLGDAIGLAITVFEKSELEQRQLILLTDGNDTGSKIPPNRAAEIAADYGIVIHTIAVGSVEAAKDGIDEATLSLIAETTGGGYFRAYNREELEAAYARIDAMKTHDAEVLTHRPSSELFYWPLAMVLCLVLVYHLCMLLVSTPRVAEDEVTGGVA